MRDTEPGRLVDMLVVGAFIEARSCERFALLADALTHEPQVANLYVTLLDSEARHFQVYLELARDIEAGDALEGRVVHFRGVEYGLVSLPADAVRFHSGPPTQRSRAA